MIALQPEPARPAIPDGPFPNVSRIVLSLRQWDAWKRQILRRVERNPVPELGPCGGFGVLVKEDVCRVTEWLSNSPSPDEWIPLFLGEPEGVREIPSRMLSCWHPSEDGIPGFFRRAALQEGFTPVPCTAYDPGKETFARVEGVFESRRLAAKTVAIVGLGSFGSYSASQLARCAGGRFILIDFDRLEPSNVARHVCGLSDVGRYKTLATRERLLDINPLCKVETHEINVVEEPGILAAAVQDSDLVLVCTDSNASRYRINEECLRRGVPAVYGGAYERAFGGSVMRVWPGPGKPCYDCVIGAVQEALGDKMRETVKGQIPYSELNDPSQFKAEPGLCVDVFMLANITAKMALLTLLRGEGASVEDFPSDFLLWGNQKEWIFPEPLYCQFVQTSFRESCPTHAKLNVPETDLARDRSVTVQMVANLPRTADVLAGSRDPMEEPHVD